MSSSPVEYSIAPRLVADPYRDRRAPYSEDAEIAVLAAMLIDQDPDLYHRPAYFGDGWVGVRLDGGDTDWSAIDQWLRRSWASVAPKRLAGLAELMEF